MGSSTSFAQRMAFGVPECRTSYVSIRRTVSSGYSLAYLSNASYSDPWYMTQLWAMVPVMGMPNIFPARTVALPEAPPMYAALAP